MQFPASELDALAARYEYADDGDLLAVGAAARARGYYTRREHHRGVRVEDAAQSFTCRVQPAARGDQPDPSLARRNRRIRTHHAVLGLHGVGVPRPRRCCTSHSRPTIQSSTSGHWNRSARGRAAPTRSASGFATSTPAGNSRAFTASASEPSTRRCGSTPESAPPLPGAGGPGTRERDQHGTTAARLECDSFD